MVMAYTNASAWWGNTCWGPGALDGDSKSVSDIQNAAQAMRAAARLDIGNNWMQNNWILALNQSSFDAFDTLGVFDDFQQSVVNSRSSLYPVTFDAVYQCRTTQLQSTGSLIISVPVATLCTFSSVWGVFMLAAAFLEKRSKNGRRARKSSIYTSNLSVSQGQTLTATSYPSLTNRCRLRKTRSLPLWS